MTQAYGKGTSEGQLQQAKEGPPFQRHFGVDSAEGIYCCFAARQRRLRGSVFERLKDNSHQTAWCRFSADNTCRLITYDSKEED